MTRTQLQQQMAELNPEGYGSLLDLFNEVCTANAAKAAFACHGVEASFADIDQRSAAFAAYLQIDLGLKTGERLAIQLPNIIDYPIAVWGAWRAGLVVVNTNPLYTAREQIHQFNDSGAVALLVLDRILPVTDAVLEQTKIKHVIVSGEAGERGFDSFNQALKRGAAQQVEQAPLSMDSLAVLQYTGGTTGPSKGAMLSHGNLFAAMRMGRQSVKLAPEGFPEVALAPLPLYHVFGFTQHVIGTFLNGGLSVLIPNPSDIDGMIKTMQNYRFSNINAVNTLLSGMMAHPDFDNIDFSNMLGTIAGGTALVKEIAEQWQARTNSTIYEGYGMSETSSSATCNRKESLELGTVGPAVNYQEIKIIDGEGNSLPAGEAGEVCLRGPNIMQGYWQREEATAETIDAEGWMRTGDIGVLQDNGRLRIVDRIKDMILVSGFNVFPNEIEEVVYSHPAIYECAAIGVPDQATGEAVKLFVVSPEPELQADDIISYCREQLAAYKVPRQIVFADDLPKSPAGKILRRELREQN
ncbi:MAG: AMP-binding protein [Gammaproteobacteria bacterium]|nr:AMP-binding protein [Gammaproteobacteria bacterium]